MASHSALAMHRAFPREADPRVETFYHASNSQPNHSDCACPMTFMFAQLTILQIARRNPMALAYAFSQSVQRHTRCDPDVGLTWSQSPTNTRSLVSFALPICLLPLQPVWYPHDSS